MTSFSWSDQIWILTFCKLLPIFRWWCLSLNLVIQTTSFHINRTVAPPCWQTTFRCKCLWSIWRNWLYRPQPKNNMESHLLQNWLLLGSKSFMHVLSCVRFRWVKEHNNQAKIDFMYSAITVYMRSIFCLQGGDIVHEFVWLI